MTYAKQIADALRLIAPGGKLFAAEIPLIDRIADAWAKRAPAKPTTLTGPATFFRKINLALGSLKQSQVDGINTLLTAMGAARWPLAWAAYGLATAWHETAKTMQPIKEYGGDTYFFRQYDRDGLRPGVAKVLGNTEAGDGVRYAGRGFVQLTGRTNYDRAGEALGLDLIANPDDAMGCDTACRILVWGMEQGTFTGKSLKTYLPIDGAAGHEAFKQARRIINGSDKSEEIAKLATTFQGALQAGGWA